MRCALCAAMCFGLLFAGSGSLQAQAALSDSPSAGLPDAPLPQCREVSCPQAEESDSAVEAAGAPGVGPGVDRGTLESAGAGQEAATLDAALDVALEGAPGLDSDRGPDADPDPGPDPDTQPVEGSPAPQAVSNQSQPAQASSQLNQNEQNKIRPGFPPSSPQGIGRPPVPSAARAGIPTRAFTCIPRACCNAQSVMSCDQQANMYRRFLSYSSPAALTPKQKLLLAYRNIRDPFNLLTIFGEAAISVASNAESAYGPGMPGFAKYSGVSLTEDATAEFFGTFLIPSLAQQDPHYRRMPNLPLKRRIIHVLDSVVIGHGDDGLPMFNYAQVFGTIATSALGNLYVPGRRRDWGASADRISVALATDPIGYAVTEFLPDVARRININVVLVQRVINRVAIEEGGAPGVQ